MNPAPNNLASAPADPSVASFLDLPAELRNNIYSELYEHEDPIIVTLSAQGVKMHRRVGDKNHRLRVADADSSKKHHLKEIIRAYQECTSLFSTCRQISREASSVFYQTNTFLLNLTCHCTWSMKKDGKHCASGSHVLEWWLYRLGSQRSLVKRIWLDLNSMCRVHCPDYFGEANSTVLYGSEPRSNEFAVAFLPFLKVVWKYNLQARLSIAQTSLPNSIVTYNMNRPPSIMPRMSITAQAFCKDTLDIAKFHRTLGYIAIREDGTGDVVHWTTSAHSHHLEISDSDIVQQYLRGAKSSKGHVCMYSRMPFFIDDDDDDDGQLRLLPKKDHTSLSILPRDLRSKIWNTFLESMPTVRINLDSATDFTTLFPMLYTNRSMRIQYAWEITQRPYLLVLSSPSVRARISSTSKLARLLKTTVAHDLTSSEPIQWNVGICADIYVKLHVTRDMSMKLDDALNMDILPLVLGSSATWNDTPLTIALDTPDREHQEFGLTLGLLRRRVLRALKMYVSERARDSGMCPAVWVNGRGLVKKVVAPGEAEDSTGQGIVGNMESKVHREEVKAGTQPPYPTDGQLDSTITYLAWVLRQWQKAK